MNNYGKFQFIIFLFLSASFVNSSQFSKIELINGEFSGTYIISTEQSQLEFEVSQIENYSYLNIKVEGNGLTPTNHIISYYQDENLNERKQLSQSLNDRTIMWLTKQQIDKVFYLTVECAKIPCNFDLILKGKESEAELYLNEQYTYYVTEQNKEMNFCLLYNTDDLKDNNTIIEVWAKSNFKIDVTLLGGERESFSDERFYRINTIDFKKDKYNLKITGIEGDLINVGFLHRRYSDNTGQPIKIIENGEEITGFIKDGLNNCFEVSNTKNHLGYYYDFNNQIKKDEFSFENNIYFFISKENESYYYTFQHLNTTEYDGQGNNKYSPLLDGIYYLKKIEKNTVIGLIPMKPENTFNYLTYEVFPLMGDMRVFIYECKNYPLCPTNLQTIENSQEIKGFQTFYKKFTKDEWKNISPISKQQKMLLINCHNGINEENTCVSIINMKTDLKYVNNTDFFREFPPARKFLLKNDKDKYFSKGNKNKKLLYIELFSGDIEVKIEPEVYPEEMTKKSGYYLYSISENKDINITITAKENAVYMINDNSYIKNNGLYIGSNSLLNIDEGEIVKFNINDISQILDSSYNYFIGIYYFNCSITIKTENEEGEKIEKSLLNKNDFFQYVFNSKDNSTFTISRKKDDKNSKDNCLFYVTTYEYELINSYADGIPLKNNTMQLFLFNDIGNYTVLLSFPHIKLDDNIYITFTLFESKDYTVELLLNNYTNKYNINKKNANITLLSNETKTYCKNANSLCKLLLQVSNDNREKESQLRIYILSNNTYNPKFDDKETNKKTNLKLILILCGVGTAFLIVIIIVVVYLIKSFNKNKNLAKEVDQISFKNENKDIEEEEGDTLLD